MAIQDFTLSLVASAAILHAIYRIGLAAFHLQPNSNEHWALWHDAARGGLCCRYFLDGEEAKAFAAERSGVCHDARNHLTFDPGFSLRADLPEADLWPLASEIFSDSIGDVQAVI